MTDLMNTVTAAPGPQPTPSASNVDLLLTMVRLESKLDHLSSQVTPRIEDHETRLRSLERSRWPLPTIATLTAVSAVVAQLWHTSH